MGVVRNTVVTQCAAEEAFDYLSDHRNEVDWGPSCEWMEKLTDGPIGVGTRFRAKWRGSPPAELEILTFDRPHAWTAISRGGMDMHFTGTIEPVAEGVRVTGELRPLPRGLNHLFAPILVFLMRRSSTATEEGMRTALERLREGRTR